MNKSLVREVQKTHREHSSLSTTYHSGFSDDAVSYSSIYQWLPSHCSPNPYGIVYLRSIPRTLIPKKPICSQTLGILFDVKTETRLTKCTTQRLEKIHVLPLVKRNHKSCSDTKQYRHPPDSNLLSTQHFKSLPTIISKFWTKNPSGHSILVLLSGTHCYSSHCNMKHLHINLCYCCSL